MSKVKWGILGCAGIAEKAVIPAIKKAENCELYALASRDKKKARDFAERFKGEKYYGDYEKLLKDDMVEAVYIPLPNSLHKEWTIRAARYGKDILCEKPLGLSYDQAREMTEVAKEEGVLLMEAFMYRFHPLVQKIKEVIDTGTLGKIKYINTNFCFNSSRPDNDIRFNKELGGGALYDIGCYCINLSRFLVGQEPVEVYNTFVEKPGTEVDNRGLGTLRFPDDILANINYSMAFYDQKDAEIVGKDGRIYVPGIFEWIGSDDKIFYLDKDDKVEEITVEGKEQYRLQVKEFAAAVLEDKKSPLDPEEDACNNIKVIDAMFESAAREEAVKLG